MKTAEHTHALSAFMRDICTENATYATHRKGSIADAQPGVYLSPSRFSLSSTRLCALRKEESVLKVTKTPMSLQRMCRVGGGGGGGSWSLDPAAFQPFTSSKLMDK